MGIGLDVTAESRRLVLDGISLQVRPGEFVGVIGGNGAGKSTLLRLLGGVYKATSGNVAVLGECWGLYELGLAGRRELTGRRYVDQQLRLQGMTGRPLSQATERAREFSELDSRFDQDPILTYSDGMRSRLFFATAFAVDHDIYLLDEVLAVGDEHFSSKCWRAIRARIAAGASGILVTHQFSSVLKLCSRAYVLEGGSIADEGPAKAVIARYLQRPRCEPDRARFASVSEHMTGSTGRDLVIPVDVEVVMAGLKVIVGFSIECFHPTIGWEMLLANHCVATLDEVGAFSVTLLIPDLPLGAGEYSLNLALCEWFDDAVTSSTPAVYDERKWLLGNDISLVVSQEDPSSLGRLPLEWHSEAIT